MFLSRSKHCYIWCCMAAATHDNESMMMMMIIFNKAEGNTVWGQTSHVCCHYFTQSDHPALGSVLITTEVCSCPLGFYHE